MQTSKRSIKIITVNIPTAAAAHLHPAIMARTDKGFALAFIRVYGTIKPHICGTEFKIHLSAANLELKKYRIMRCKFKI